MAREFASIKVSIWNDDDFRDISPEAKLLYFTLLTHPSLSHCGVCDWRPGRLASITGMSRETIEAVGAEMTASLHLVIDEETEEVLIRSFVRHDGIMKQPKMAVSMANAHASVASRVIRGVIVFELIRLHEEYPDLHGWGSDKASALLTTGSINPSSYPLGKGSIKGLVKGSVYPKATPNPKGSIKGSPTPAPAPATTTCSLVTSGIGKSRPADTPPRDDVERLCNQLADAIENNGVKRPTITQRWRNECRLMLDKDGITETELSKCITWATGHHFWKTNILSMPKLREKYTQLKLTAESERQKPGGYNPSQQSGVDVAAWIRGEVSI